MTTHGHRGPRGRQRRLGSLGLRRLALFALFLPGGVVACSGQGGSASEAPERPDMEPSARAEEADAEEEAQRGPGPFPGVIVPRRVVELPARAEGQMVELRVGTGERVEGGAVVARIDPRNARRQLQATEASLASATAARERVRAQLANARLRLARRRAAGSRVVSAEETETVEGEVAQLTAQLEVSTHTVAEMRARVGQRRDELGNVAIVAPWDGVVAARYVEAGGWVERGQAILRLLSAGSPRVRFAVPESAGRSIAEGMAVQVRVVPEGPTLGGEVRAVAPEIDPASRMIFVEAGLELSAEEEARLHPGQEVRVRPQGRAPLAAAPRRGDPSSVP